jgi:hypothetical protein
MINPRSKNNKTYQYSFARNLRKEGKTTQQFEIMLSTLKLEELIALKLELSAKPLKGKLFGFPLWNSSFHIIKGALINFALSAASSHKEAANILGLSLSELRKSIKQFNVKQEGENHD